MLRCRTWFNRQREWEQHIAARPAQTEERACLAVARSGSGHANRRHCCCHCTRTQALSRRLGSAVARTHYVDDAKDAAFVYAQVLLGSRFHGVFPGHAVADALDRHFLLHDFTPAALRKGLQVLSVPLVKRGVAIAAQSQNGFGKGSQEMPQCGDDRAGRY